MLAKIFNITKQAIFLFIYTGTTRFDFYYKIIN